MPRARLNNLVLIIVMALLLISATPALALEQTQGVSIYVVERLSGDYSTSQVVYEDIMLSGFNNYLGGVDFSLSYDAGAYDLVGESGKWADVNPLILNSSIFKLEKSDSDSSIRIVLLADDNQNDEAIPIAGVSVGTAPVKLATVTFHRYGAGQVQLELHDLIKVVQPENQLENVIAIPSVNPVAGTYASAQNVTLWAEEGATIYYTTDGSTPTENSSVYAGVISVSADTIIKAVAVKKDTSSAVAIFNYIIQSVPGALVATPGAGTYDSAQNITLTAEAGTDIYYTVDGSIPTLSSNKYTVPIQVNANTIIKAIIVKQGVVSSVATFEYIIQSVEPGDHTPPVYQGVVLESTKKIATIIFSENLLNNKTNADELKAAITLATDGKNFNALGVNDQVTINGNALVVTFSTALTGINNKIKVAGNTLKDTQANVLTGDVTTDAINAGIDECFIATAAYGSKFEPAVVLLRQFRDSYLMTNSIGVAFVQFYYRNSPPIARYIAGSELLKSIIRVLLTPIVVIVYLILHPVLIGTTLVITLIVMFGWWNNRREYKLKKAF